MGSSNGTSMSTGVVAIILATIAVSEVITEITGSYSHWVFAALGILMGLRALRSIR